MPPDELEDYADGIDAVGKMAGEQMADSGMPAVLMAAAGPAADKEPWASPDPRVMTGTMATFVRAAATAERNKDDSTDDAITNARQMADFAAIAELVGTEPVDNRQAFHIRASDLNYSQPGEDGQEFIINTVSLWLDTEYYVPLKLRMDGVMLADGQSRAMYIEKIDSDYRSTGSMYESYKQTMLMGGILDPKTQAETAKAKADIAELDARMAAMSPGEKELMEKMMGSQLETMRNMVAGSGFRIVTTVRKISINAGLPDTTEMGMKVFQTSDLNVSAAPPAQNISLPAAQNAPPPATPDPAALRAEQQACLQKKKPKPQRRAEKRNGDWAGCSVLSGVRPPAWATMTSPVFRAMSMVQAPLPETFPLRRKILV